MLNRFLNGPTSQAPASWMALTIPLLGFAPSMNRTIAATITNAIRLARVRTRRASVIAMCPSPPVHGLPDGMRGINAGRTKHMPRSIWNGTITFGLIAVPIKVYSATESHTIHFHQVHEKDGARIKQKRMCAKEGKEVPYKEVAMGYEVRGGEFVMLEKEEIDAAAGDRAHTIELEQF